MDVSSFLRRRRRHQGHPTSGIPTALPRGVLAGVLVGIAILLPHHTTVSANAASSLPVTTSGIHLAMEFNNDEPEIDGPKTQEGNVDYVFGASGWVSGGIIHNIAGHAFHDLYLSWPRDGAWYNSHPIAWYRQYHPDWLLYENDRTTIPTVWGDNVAPLDFTNPAVQSFVENTWIKPALEGGYGGVVFDNGLGLNYLGAAGHYTTAGAWVQLYSGAADDQVYATAQVAAFQAIAAWTHAYDPAATVSLNQGNDCNDTQSLLTAGDADADLLMSQVGFENNGAYLTQYGNAYCPNGKWLTVMQWATQLASDGVALDLVNTTNYAITPNMTATNSQARADLQWALANYLLAKGSHTYFQWSSWNDQAGSAPVMQPEYTTAQRIGSPTDDFYACSGGPQCPAGVYMRDFTGGLALVNPAPGSSYTVSFPAGKYRDLYGNPVTSSTLPAHSGLVLLDATAPPAPSTPTATNTPLPTPATPTSSAPAPTIAVEGTDHGLWVKHGSGSWLNLGGILSAAPAVAQMPGGGDLYLVAGSDHTLWERSDTSSWQELSSFACQDNPAAAISGSTLYVACQGADHASYIAQTTVSGNAVPSSLSAFSSWGGETTSGPAVAFVNGNLAAFLIGTDHRIWWRTAGSSWQPLSSSCTDHPAASTYGAITYLACHGTDGALWYATTSGAGWSAFRSAGGSVTDGPAVAATSSGALLVIESSTQADLATQLGSNGTLTGWQGTGGLSLHGSGAG